MGLLLEEFNLYIKINIYGMYVKFLVDIGVIFVFMLKILFEIIL